MKQSIIITFFLFIGVPHIHGEEELVKPIPLTVPFDEKKAALGQLLFSDKRFSKDNSVSCASCHILEMFGVDHLPTSKGVYGTEGKINTNTVFNSGFSFVQFWDGRAATLEEQIEKTIDNPTVFDSNWTEVIGKLKQDNDYPRQFKEAYKDDIKPEHIKDAIATFERSLITPNSRFDKWLRGDAKALTADEIKGFETFKSMGCIFCHSGVNLGGNSFQKMGVVKDYFADRGNIIDKDYGRYNVTKDENDKFTFKVPTLRNIAQTYPYFHDGSAKTLEEAVKVMGKYQMGIEIKDEDVTNIVKFLKTLNGEYKGLILQEEKI
jgi:cytochrome c peroxidase